MPNFGGAAASPFGGAGGHTPMPNFGGGGGAAAPYGAAAAPSPYGAHAGGAAPPSPYGGAPVADFGLGQQGGDRKFLKAKRRLK